MPLVHSTTHHAGENRNDKTASYVRHRGKALYVEGQCGNKVGAVEADISGARKRVME